MDKINKKATIYDYARMCKKINKCKDCPLGTKNNGVGIACSFLMRKAPDKANEIILKWREEHPVETRQDRFLKMFPNAWLDDNKMLDLCPKRVDKNYTHKNQQCIDTDCDDCKKAYWLAEVDE